MRTTTVASVEEREYMGPSLSVTRIFSIGVLAYRPSASPPLAVAGEGLVANTAAKRLIGHFVAAHYQAFP